MIEFGLMYKETSSFLNLGHFKLTLLQAMLIKGNIVTKTWSNVLKICYYNYICISVISCLKFVYTNKMPMYICPLLIIIIVQLFI